MAPLQSMKLTALAFVALSACIPPATTPVGVSPPGYVPGGPDAAVGGAEAAPGDGDDATPDDPYQADAPSGVAAPAAPTGGSFDLVYRVPAGWSEQRGADLITLRYDEESDWVHRHYTILILPSQGLRGSLGDTYQALWREQILPLFTPGFEPAPFRRRLASGYACWFDGDTMVATNGQPFQAVLYMIAAGDRVVPIVALYTDLEQRAEGPIQAFFDALTLSDAAPSGEPLFLPAELAGEWNTHAASYANYVDSGGNFRGDATIATGEHFILGADGRYQAWFTAAGGGTRAFQDNHTGAWTVEDDFLVFAGGDEQRRLRIYAVGTSPRGGGAIFLPPSYDASDAPDFTMPRRPISGDWYGRM